MIRNSKGKILLLLLLLAGVITLFSSPAPPFTERDKAFYADEALVNFVRPGLVMKVLGASIAADGAVTARVRFTDPRGLPLDREGITTPGTIACSFVLAWIRPDGQYWAYTTRVQTSPITGVSATQAAGENNGTWTKVAEGEYTYLFRARVPADFVRTATHSVGIYGSRNLSEFSLGVNYDDDVFDFVPAGGPVRVVRDLIKTSTCNKCHLDMGFHGGSRKTMELCNLCHTPQTTDPDTGHTVDMPVMTHKIHMGAQLPSVIAGSPYKIIGNQQSVHDYSNIVFPPGPNNCKVCHEDGKGVAQPENYLKASRAACGSCHDNVDFTTGRNHAGIVQLNDTGCNRCHPSRMALEFDISVEGAHVVPTQSKQLPGVNFEILDVTNTRPGERPTVTFTLKDDSGTGLDAATMSRLRIYLAGANSDYTRYLQEDATRATPGQGPGLYRYTMTNPIPADARGSWTIAIEGRRDITLYPGTASARTIRDSGVNKQFYFSVDGSPVQPRRKAVELDKCNACHFDLSFHGGARNTIEECVICHNPTATANPEPRRTIEMGVMIHKIHRGAALTRGYGIANQDYSKVGYPGDLRNCVSCHVEGTQQIPRDESRLPVVSPFDFISPAGRTTANCLACHDSRSAAAHASTNTDARLGEACYACHGPNGAAAVSRVHAR